MNNIRKHFGIVISSFCVCTAIAVFAAAESREENRMTTVILIRHAEKAAESGDNPPLSDAGKQRAVALRHTLEHSRVTTIFATQYQRTQQTVEPLAQAMKLRVTKIEAAATDKLVAQIREKHVGQTVVVAGHSNTIPAIIRSFGIANAPEIAENDFDNLLILTISEKGDPKLLELQYGEAN